jgi:hypothetical protein
MNHCLFALLTAFLVSIASACSAAESGGDGGLGIDLQGEPIVSEFDWGAGVANAWKSATGFEGGLAIGLSITENDNPDGLSRIVAGDFDENIRQLAKFFSMIEGPVYLRIGYTDIRQCDCLHQL